MTQMGLEYAKLLESKRHNVATEQDTDDDRAVKQQEADTHKYVASFEDRKTSASEKQAKAAASQAETARRKQSLSETYAERDMLAKEKQAIAAKSQADTAISRQDLEEFKTFLDNITDTNASYAAMQKLGSKYGIETTGINTPGGDSALTFISKVFDKIAGPIIKAFSGK